MLPMKLNNTKELAIKLRDLRLKHPVNGEVLTAENLSKAIGKYRAWMSQIESRRLKKIKREDIIKIYKLLYNESDDYLAEYRAETDLTSFILDSEKEDKTILTGGAISQQFSDDNFREYRESHGGNSYTENDLLSDRRYLVSVTNNIIEIFMHNLQHIPSCIDHNKYINQFSELEEYLDKSFDDTLFLIKKLPLYALSYATEEEHQHFIDSVNTLGQYLGKISLMHNFEQFKTNLSDAKEIVSNYNVYKPDLSEKEMLEKVTLLLVDLSNYITNPLLSLSMDEKIEYTNDLIFIIYSVSNIVKSKQLFSVSYAPTDSNLDDILAKINELQNYLSSIKNNPFIIQGQISKYFTT